MYPHLHVFGLELNTYGLCAVVGIFIAAILVILRMKGRRDYNRPHMALMIIFAFIGAFICAHILYAITRIDFVIYLFQHNVNIFQSSDTLFQVLSEIFGGMVFYGGLIGALLGGKIYCHINKLDFDTYSDLVAPAIPLFHAFGRVGCILAGCCYGIESSWGLPYPVTVNGIETTVIRLPVPLIEAGCNLVIMAILLLLSRTKLKKGSLLAVYFMLYAIVRFTDEFFRGDEIRGRLLGITTSQWISIILFLFGIWMLLKRYVLPGKERFGYPLKKGEIPAGYAYHPSMGAIPPHEIERSLGLLRQKGGILPEGYDDKTAVSEPSGDQEPSDKTPDSEKSRQDTSRNKNSDTKES